MYILSHYITGYHDHRGRKGGGGAGGAEAPPTLNQGGAKPLDLHSRLCTQSTMTQKQLNHVMLLHTHKDRTDKKNLLEIARVYFL